MFVCLHVPDFPTQASLLQEPPEARASLTKSPLAILDGPANLPRVFATNPSARRAGIEIGMTKLQVETYGGVALRKRSRAAEDAAQTALADFAGKFSPRVESTCPGSAILDLTGMEKLLGPLPAIARKLTVDAVAIGFDLRAAIASNPDTAFLAAQGFCTNTLIPAGEECRRLAPLRVSILPIAPEMLEVLQNWGIRAFAAFAALPAVAVVERLGQEGLYLQKLARGEINRTLLTAEASAEFTASFEFDDPVETLESIFFILNRLLQQLCSNLLSAALATNELRLTVELKVRKINKNKDRIDGNAENEKHAHEWKIPVPTQDKNALFSLIRLHLEKTTFSAPIQKLAVEVVPTKPRVAQGNLFAPPAPEPEKLEITLERIRGMVGDADADGIACVGSPYLLDTHQPGGFSVRHFSSVETSAHSNSKNTVSPARLGASVERSRRVPCGASLAPASHRLSANHIAIRIFRPPIETSVELDGERPHFVWLWQRHRRVLAASGPWCSSGNWWDPAAWMREEWDVALKTPAGLGFYRIYRNCLRRQWFVEGVFD